MTDRTAAGDDRWVDRVEAMALPAPTPGSVRGNGIVIVAAPDEAVAGAVSLRLGIGDERPTCIVATSAESAKLESYVSDLAPDRPPLGFVDATPDRPTPAAKDELRALEDIPSPRDLLQLTTAVGEVCETVAPDDPVNIVIPTFGALLGVAPTDRVVRVLSHIADATDSDGRVVIGFDYTTGSNKTLRTLKAHSDVILWTERDGDGTLRLDSESL